MFYARSIQNVRLYVYGVMLMAQTCVLFALYNVMHCPLQWCYLALKNFFHRTQSPSGRSHLLFPYDNTSRSN